MRWSRWVSLASCECALRWRRSGEARWFRAAALALTFLVWTKNEGLLYAALLVPLFFLGARRRPSRGELLLLAGPAGVAALGLWLNARFGLRPYVFLESAPEGDPLGRPLALVGGYTLLRVAQTLQGAFELLILQPRWQAGLLLAFLGGCCLAPRSALRGERRPLTLFLWGALLALLAVYPCYPFEVPWNLAASFTRVLAQLLPTVVLWLAMSLARLPRVRGRSGRSRGTATACTLEP
ncbi:MAG: hypothetical protein EXS08_10600 [Planctomycetes bacterium]|nr:hypothetical protein [Planctomycetota bacterium]